MADHPKAVRLAVESWWGAIEAELPRLVAEVAQARIVWIVGNGGSQAVAEHWATDWHKATMNVTPTAYITPFANSALLTMLANDYGYAATAQGSLKGATNDDVVIGISTSGESANLLQGGLDWAVCPEGCSLLRVAGRALSGPLFAPAVLEDVYAVIGHAVAEELRQVVV